MNEGGTECGDGTVLWRRVLSVCDGGMCVCVCVCDMEVCVCVCVMEGCVCVSGVCVCMCVCDSGMCACVCVFVCEMEVGVEQEGLEECQDHSLYFGQKEQSGTCRQGFLCVSLVPQRLRKNWPTADS